MNSSFVAMSSADAVALACAAAVAAGDARTVEEARLACREDSDPDYVRPCGWDSRYLCTARLAQRLLELARLGHTVNVSVQDVSVLWPDGMPVLNTAVTAEDLDALSLVPGKGTT